MENGGSIPPCNDPTDDNPSTDHLLMLNENSCLGLQEFPETAEPSSRNALSFPPSNNYGDTSNILDPDDILAESFIWEVLNESSGNEAENFEADPSGINGERVGQGNASNCDIPQSSGFGNPIQLSIWPVPPSPYNCSCCHILREVIHTNGKRISNLEIHGRLGIISHAVLDKYDYDLSTEDHEYQMFDFCKESVDSVKNFLVQYCQDRKQEGYTMIQDPLSIFYETLCVGLDEKEYQDVASGTFLQTSAMVSGLGNAENDGSGFVGSDQQETLSQQNAESSEGPVKTSLSTQRERTGKLKLKDFSKYFHLPINDAAKRMKVCPTVIKKKCRQEGMARWPYRKIKGIKRKISMKEESLTAATAEERAPILAEIQMLEQELKNLSAELSSR